MRFFFFFNVTEGGKWDGKKQIQNANATWPWIVAEKWTWEGRTLDERSGWSREVNMGGQDTGWEEWVEQRSDTWSEHGRAGHWMRGVGGAEKWTWEGRTLDERSGWSREVNMGGQDTGWEEWVESFTTLSCTLTCGQHLGNKTVKVWGMLHTVYATAQLFSFCPNKWK